MQSPDSDPTLSQLPSGVGGTVNGRNGPGTAAFSMFAALSLALSVPLAFRIFSMNGNSPGSLEACDLSSTPRTSLGRCRGDNDNNGSDDQWVELISWEPRIFIYHNFLSKGECEYLINLGKTEMLKLADVDNGTENVKNNGVQISLGIFIPRGYDEIVRAIEERIAHFTFIPVEHGEGLQILNYEVGLKYGPNYDYFPDEFNTKNGSQRISTVVMYLSDVEDGGETMFPSAAKGTLFDVPCWNEISECGKWGLSLKPKMGDALLLWNMYPDGALDPYSLRGGCPVIRGNKWTSTKWIRLNEYMV